MTLSEPPAGESVEKLWTYVVALTKLVNALANAEVKVTSPTPTGGKVVSTTDHAVIVIE